MIREVAHFFRHAPDVMKLQKELSRAAFVDTISAKADAQGYGGVRRDLVADLAGEVLEVGCGTGCMFQYYPDAVTRIEAIEPEQDFCELAIDKAGRTEGRIHASIGDGMALSYEDASFDAVVFGLVLCSVPSVEHVLVEARRVLRPGGKLRALEHVRSEGLLGGALMHAMNPLWLKLNGQGCNWNRDPVPAIRSGGFEVDEVSAFQLFDTVVPAFPMRAIRAHRADA